MLIRYTSRNSAQIFDNRNYPAVIRASGIDQGFNLVNTTMFNGIPNYHNNISNVKLNNQIITGYR